MKTISDLIPKLRDLALRAPHDAGPINITYGGGGDEGHFNKVNVRVPIDTELVFDLAEFGWDAAEAAGIYSFGDGDEAWMHVDVDLAAGDVEVTHCMETLVSQPDQPFVKEDAARVLALVRAELGELLNATPSLCVNVALYGSGDEGDVSSVYFTEGRGGADLDTKMPWVPDGGNLMAYAFEVLELGGRDSFCDDQGGEITVAFDLGANEVWFINAGANGWGDEYKVRLVSGFEPVSESPGDQPPVERS